ncbi:nitrite/sulfite reductase [Rhodovibrionaceae bacterium A322]
MYRYDEFDHSLVRERVSQFKGQVARRLTGDLSEDQFKPLRLMNGVYLQLHAYMLRVAIPYGTLSSKQLRKLGDVAETYDKGYGHFTTRQNIQYNWPALKDIPAALEELATVEMHAIQTSGNCIRNVTADQYAGAAADEVEDSRVTGEVLRQWSTFHPEFTYLPRKFKFAVTASEQDRAAVKVHDIGLVAKKNAAGELGYEVIVGGGQGRTPVIGKTIREFLPKAYLLSYVEAILRVYNQLGRRDNLYKARIKILVNETGVAEFTRLVEEEWMQIRDGYLDLPAEEFERIQAYFAPPEWEELPEVSPAFEAAKIEDPGFAYWVRSNVAPHKKAGYAIAVVSLKPEGGVAGDATAGQMRLVADLAELYSFGEIRVSHEQNLVLPHVRQQDLYNLYRALKGQGLGPANSGLLTDMIVCPGLDYCNLANARSIPLSQKISKRFNDLKRLHDIGSLTLNISGCINACGHHHVANIGILGVNKRGTELYQITLGGRADQNAAIGKLVGPGFTEDEAPDAVEKIVEVYLEQRQTAEAFVDTFDRIGLAPFKEKLYGNS